MKTTFPLREVLQYILVFAKIYEKRVIFMYCKLGNKNYNII